MTSPYDRWLLCEPELPEDCPECGGPNSTDDGHWLEPDAAPWCSRPCMDAGLAREEAWYRNAMGKCPACGLDYYDHVEWTTTTIHDDKYGDIEVETPICPTGDNTHV